MTRLKSKVLRDRFFSGPIRLHTLLSQELHERRIHFVSMCPSDIVWTFLNYNQLRTFDQLCGSLSSRRERNDSV